MVEQGEGKCANDVIVAVKQQFKIAARKLIEAVDDEEMKVLGKSNEKILKMRIIFYHH